MSSHQLRFIRRDSVSAGISIGRSNSTVVTGTGSSMSIGWASGGAAASGTWLVAVVHTTVGGTGTISGGSAWTQIGTSKVWYKQCGPSEPATYSITYAASSKGEGTVATICEILGASSMESSASATSTSTSPSVTSTASGDCVVLAMGHDNSAATITPPTGYTKQSSISDTTSAQASAIATKLNVGTGTIAPGSWNSAFRLLASLAFKP